MAKKEKRFSVSFSDDTAKLINKIAEERSCSLAAVVRVAVTEGLKNIQNNT